jgi:hypothetical protein
MPFMNIFDSGSPLIPYPAPIPVIGESLAFLSDRMDKITQACVMIASVAPDNHQLLSHNVEYAIQIMTLVHECEYAPEFVTVSDVERINIGIRHTTRNWELCHIAGLISDMNYQVVITELKNLNQFIQEKLMTYCIGQVTHPFRIPETDTDNQKPQQISVEHYFSGKNFTEKKIQSSVSETPIPSNISTYETLKNIAPQKDNVTVSSKSNELASKQSTEKSFTRFLNQSPIKPVSGEDKKERRDAIMRTIRSKGQVTIKDISENIRGCSEKTIQRDLQELIQHGVLIREGEKRWAVYKLAMKNI